MTSQEEKVQRFLMGKPKKQDEQQPVFSLKNTILGRDWYLSNWFEKLIFVLGFFALLWTLLELAFLGRF